KLTIVRRGDKVYIGSTHAPLVRLGAQIDPTSGGIDVIDGALVFHFADAAEGDRDPIRILIRKKTANDIDIRDHAPHRRLGVRCGDVRCGDLVVKLPAGETAADD